MKIDPSKLGIKPQGTNETTRPQDKSGKASKESPDRGRDSIEISRDAIDLNGTDASAKLLRSTTEHEPIDVGLRDDHSDTNASAERLAQVRALLDTGFYDEPEVLSSVAQRIIAALS